MKTFHIMTRESGHDTTIYEDDVVAEKEFNERIKSGLIAANLLPGGEQKQVKDFKDAKENVVFHRPLQGG